MKKMMKYFALSLLMFSAAVHCSPIAQSASRVSRAVKSKKSKNEIERAYGAMYEGLLKANGKGLQTAQSTLKRVASFNKELANDLRKKFPLPKNSLSRARAQLQQALSAKKVNKEKIQELFNDYSLGFFINGGKPAKSDEALRKQLENKLDADYLDNMYQEFINKIATGTPLAEKVPGLQHIIRVQSGIRGIDAQRARDRRQQEEQRVLDDVSDDTSSVIPEDARELPEDSLIQEDEEEQVPPAPELPTQQNLQDKIDNSGLSPAYIKAFKGRVPADPSLKDSKNIETEIKEAKKKQQEQAILIQKVNDKLSDLEQRATGNNDLLDNLEIVKRDKKNIVKNKPTTISEFEKKAKEIKRIVRVLEEIEKELAKPVSFELKDLKTDDERVAKAKALFPERARLLQDKTVEDLQQMVVDLKALIGETAEDNKKGEIQGKINIVEKIIVKKQK